MSKAHPTIAILGSSSGLLAFYTIALFPHCYCIGYEILPTLHQLAREVTETFSIGEFGEIKTFSSNDPIQC